MQVTNEQDDKRKPFISQDSGQTRDEVSRAVIVLVTRVFASRIPQKLQAIFSIDDLAQETSIKLTQLYQESGGKVEWTEAYVFAVAQRTLIDHVRKHFAQKREPDGGFANVNPQSSMNLLGEITKSQKTPSQIGILNELWPLVNAHLNLQEQLIVELRYLQDLSNAEIGSLLERTESSIRGQLFRIHEKLRQELSKRPDFESFC